jgi:predicted transcriptional regulator
MKKDKYNQTLITFKIDEDVAFELTEFAHDERVSRSVVIREAIVAHLARSKKGKK